MSEEVRESSHQFPISFVHDFGYFKTKHVACVLFVWTETSRLVTSGYMYIFISPTDSTSKEQKKRKKQLSMKL